MTGSHCPAYASNPLTLTVDTAALVLCAIEAESAGAKVMEGIDANADVPPLSFTFP